MTVYNHKDCGVWRIIQSKLDGKRQCWYSFSSSSHIIQHVALVFLNKLTHYKVQTLSPVPRILATKQRKLWDESWMKSTIQPTETFQKRSAYDTQAIFSMALIFRQSRIQPTNNAIGGVHAPFTSLCSSQHSNRWKTQQSKARLLWQHGTITGWWRIGFVKPIQTLQFTDKVQKSSQNLWVIPMKALEYDPSCHPTVWSEHPVSHFHAYEKEKFVPPTEGECEKT